MIVELHLLQSFAPSNLNRDDTGAPKDCDFGGVRRARISSQCLKRAMRRSFGEAGLLPVALRATRTKRVVAQVADALAPGRDPETAIRLAERLLAAGGIKSEGGQVGALVFLGGDEVAALARLAETHAGELLAAGGEEAGTSRHGRKAGVGGLPDLKGEVARALGAAGSVDVALFGRMIAELPAGNVDAAAQVAHAISTHRVEVDFDYYTALDELASADETGAAMVGTTEFNAACYYRYAAVDVGALNERLADPDRSRLALEAFVRACILAEPTGKQNSMAAHNPPSYVLGVVRDAGNWSLANAFLRPVRPDRDRDLVDGSIDALEGYWERLARMYGTRGLRSAASVALAELPERSGIERLPDVDRLIARVLGVAAGTTG